MTNDPAEPSPHDPYAAWRVGAYRFYFVGWMLSVIGQQIQGIAVALDVYKRTGDPLSLGWVGLVQWAPNFLLALAAGQVADRVDRRWIIAVAQAGACLTGLGMAAVAYRDGSILALYGLLGLNSVCHAFNWPARSALLPQIVPPHAFANAAAWNSSGFQLASVAGPVVGGLIAYLSIPLAYAIDAGTSLAFAVFALRLAVRPVERRASAGGVRDVVEGIRFVFRTRIILATITLDLFAVLLGGAVYLLPIFALDLLQVGDAGLGWLRAAPAAGALLMALALAHLPPMKKAGRNLLWAVAGFGLATVVFGLSRNFWLSWAMLFLTGAFDNISVVIRQTLVQMLTPDHMRGRVASVNNIFVGASNDLGGFESGLTARWWGPRAATVVGGLGTIFVVTAVAAAWPQIRRFGSLRHARPAEPAPTATGETAPV